LREAVNPDAPAEVVTSAKRLAAMVLERGLPRSPELAELLQTVLNGRAKSE
jgi:hypothetical protein